MNSWFAAANFTYRHAFVKSLASSASSGSRYTISWVRLLKSLAARSSARGERAATICGSSANSCERLALGDALGAERHVDVEPEPRDQPLDDRGDTRVDGAAEHEELTVAEMRGDLVDGTVDGTQVGVVVLVDRRADHDHDVLGVGDRSRVEGGGEEAVVAGRGEHLGRARLDEGHPTRVHGVHGVVADVVERDVQPATGEGKPQWEPDAAAPPDDRDVERLRHSVLSRSPHPGIGSPTRPALSASGTSPRLRRPRRTARAAPPSGNRASREPSHRSGGVPTITGRSTSSGTK